MNYKAQLARLDIKITTGMEHTYFTFALCSESARETVLQSTSQAKRKGADTVNRKGAGKVNKKGAGKVNRKGVGKVNRKKGRVIVSDVVYGLAKYTEIFIMQCERAFCSRPLQRQIERIKGTPWTLLLTHQ